METGPALTAMQAASVIMDGAGTEVIFSTVVFTVVYIIRGSGLPAGFYPMAIILFTGMTIPIISAMAIITSITMMNIP